jgi:hypothetical protein
MPGDKTAADRLAKELLVMAGTMKPGIARNRTLAMAKVWAKKARKTHADSDSSGKG